MYSALDRVLTTPVEGLEKMRETARERIRDIASDFVADRILQAIRYVSSCRRAQI